ncbi:50S ribosomal protein L30 [Buchnera aphidicola]|uniref:50S ribosomal protein L30 n=1 Tax=Buchnera aphidicola TaxID=9 RepID=UPI0031B7FD45
MKKKITITQIKSSIGRIPNHRGALKGLGLRHIGHKVILNDTPAIRGMISKIFYMVKISKG